MKDITVPDEATLTPKEKCVIFYLAQGLTNRQISKLLFTSSHTIKAHLASIYEKLRVTNRVQAVIKSLQIGEVKLSDIKIADKDIEAKYK